MKSLLIVILAITIFLQTSFFNVPLVLGLLIMMWILYQAGWVIVTAFITGILIDILTFHTFGISSMFFLTSLFLVLLYQRKFEIQSVPFVSVSVFVFSLLYAAIFIHKSSLLGAVVTSCIITICYMGVVFFSAGKRSVSLGTN